MANIRQQAPRRPTAAQEGTESVDCDSGACVDPGDASVPFSASQDVLLSAMNERELQATVVHGLRQRGYVVWTVPDMRMTTAGLPDLIAVHPDRMTLLMWELKTERGRVRPEQMKAIAHLEKIPGIDARIVRPRDWGWLKEVI